jgi:Mlc titration factor MtfA (ptsG expression regulator)
LRTSQPHDRWFAVALGALAVAAGGLLGWLFAAGGGALGGGALGVAAAVALSRSVGRREQRRRALLAKPFPETWRRILAERYDHFDRLSAPLRRRFEDDIRIFLAEKRISGIGTEATPELKLLVAASAVTLSLGWPDYEWEQLAEVLLYPQDFDRDYGFEKPELAGEAHVWGTVILSVPALEESFADPDDAYHVGLHEFAHLLDLDQARFGGIPAGLPARSRTEWTDLVEREMERLRRGKSVLDSYGSDDPSEFLAVAVEAFFEIPLLMRHRHKELYELLARSFAQDPAAWDEDRGLEI